MKNSTALKSLAALSLAALLAACNSTSSDEDKTTHTKENYIGSLSDLTVVDSTATRIRWKLVLDTAVQGGPILQGQCAWEGFLGDSSRVTGQTRQDGLYTHPDMKGNLPAQAFRTEGVMLVRDFLTDGANDSLTDFRVEFDCTP